MIIKLAKVLMLLCSLPLFTNGQQSVCTRLTTSMQTYQYYAQGSYQESYSCGFLWLSTCYSTSYILQLRYGSNIVYHQEVVCCSGYSSVGGGCLRTCPNCPESHSCLAPYFCACPENWSGEGCTEPPQNVALTATGPDTLRFSWSPPPEFQATLYAVIFQHATYQFNPSSDLVMDLDSLNTYTRYTCCVAANTTSGASRIACATQTTLETAPGDAPRNMNLKTLNSTAIRIQWDPPLTPNGIIIQYTVYINGIPIWNVRGSYGTQSTSVGGFSPNQVLRVSLSASTSVGEGPSTASQIVTTHESVPGPVENLRVLPRSGYILRVTWSPPTYTNGVLIGYTVVVTNLVDTTDTIRKTASANSRQLTIDRGIRPYVRYRVSTTASTKVGPGDPVTETLYSKQGAPQSPPPNVNSARKSPTTSSVEWDGIRWEDLRGWLVDYEIGYGSEMMSHAHQQCPANDSTYTEILSVDSGGEHELTGLDPGLQYCVRLAGRTSAGVGPFSHTLIPWYFNSLFTLTLEKANCTEWIAQDPEEIMVDLARDIGRGVEFICHCKFPDKYIANGQLMCQNDSLILYQGRIISTDDRDSSDLLADLEKWLSSEPTIIAQGEVLKIVKKSTIPEKTPTVERPVEQTDTSSDDILAPIFGGVAGVVAVLVILAVGVIMTVVVLRKHRSSSKSIDMKCKTDSSASKPTTTMNRYTSNTSTASLSLGVAKDYEKQLKSTTVKQDRERQEIYLDYEVPVAETENVYEDPDAMTEPTAAEDSSYLAGYEVMTPGEGFYESGEEAEETYSELY